MGKWHFPSHLHADIYPRMRGVNTELTQIGV